MKRKAVVMFWAIVVVIFLFFVYVAIVPQFERTNTALPVFCDDSYNNPLPPAHFAYILPEDKGTGILVTQADGTAVIAQIATTTHASDVYLVDESSNNILQTEHFPNDTIMAGITGGVVYLYNDKLGYFLNAHTGAPEQSIFTIDNYGGLSESDRPILPGTATGTWYIETSAIISSWNKSGIFRLRSHTSMNAIARGCFIDGTTGEVTKL